MTGQDIYTAANDHKCTLENVNTLFHLFFSIYTGINNFLVLDMSFFHEKDGGQSRPLPSPPGNVLFIVLE